MTPPPRTGRSDHVLDAIDNALRAFELSEDAMRWSPDGHSESHEARVFADVPSAAANHLRTATDETAPPILNRIPPGTRPVRFAYQIIAADVLGQPGAVQYAQERLICASVERPHVIRLVDDTYARIEFGISLSLPSDRSGARAMIALWLEAIPGQLSTIVYRPGPDMPDGFLPSGLNGRWENRPPGPQFRLAFFADLMNSTMVTAQPTGRIEINEAGAVAEVYEVRQ